MQIKYAKIGSISHGTLKTDDLLSAFIGELERQMASSSDYLCQPEKFNLRDRLMKIIGDAQDIFSEDGESLTDEELASEMVNETFPDALYNFCPPYVYFGPHPGDGSDYGFWPMDIEEIKESVDFTSSKENEYPDNDYQGEWLHVNERGNCTLYVRNNGTDSEIWSIV